MSNTVVIQAAGRFDTDAAVPAARLKRHLKEAHGVDARRLSRLSMLALAGGLLPSLRAAADAHTAVYLASGFGSPSVFTAMLDNVFRQQLAKPFDFLAHLHNAPSFHLAAALGSCGPTLFQAATSNPESWSKPLLLAANSIIVGVSDRVLVGWCHEHQPAQNNTQEGSLWLLLHRTGSHGAALPQLRITRGEAPPAPPPGGYAFQDAADCLAGLARPTVQTVHAGSGLLLLLQGREGFALDGEALLG